MTDHAFDPKSHLAVFVNKIKQNTPSWAWVFVAIAILISFSIGLHELSGDEKSKDFPLWFRTGQAVLHGQPIYHFDTYLDFLYSPFAATLFAPLTVFGKIPLYVFIILSLTAAWYASLSLTFRLLNISKPKLWMVFLPSVFLLDPIVTSYDLGQPNLVLMALCLTALWVDYQGKSLLGGSLLGACIAFKLFPVMILPYWLVRGRWKAAGACLAVALICTFAIPALVRGPAQLSQDLNTWWPAISRVDETQLAQRPWNWGYKNQSLVAVTHRYLRPVDINTVTDKAPTINIANLGYHGANSVYIGLAVALGAAFLWLIRRTDRNDLSREIRLWGILLCLVCLASPLARNYYFVWLLVPLTLLYAGIYGPERFAMSQSKKIYFAVVALLILGSGFMPKILSAYGVTLLATLALSYGLGLQVLAAKDDKPPTDGLVPL